MKALVTGATGFLGGRLTQRLIEAGWDVTALGRNVEAGHMLAKIGARFLQADLRSQEHVLAACAGQDAVFHCGALSAAWGAYRSFYETNAAGTEHVLAGCRQHEVGRLIHVSTPSVYFGASDRLGVKESDVLPARQASAYAATKRLAEAAVERAAAAGLPAVMIRPRAIFGPGDTSILPRLIEANVRTGVPMIDKGRAIVDLTYVDNVVDALLLCQSAPPHVLGRTYNITNGEPAVFSEAVSALFDKLGMRLKAKPIPFAAAYAAAAAMELAAKVLPGEKEPMLTRAVVGMLGRSQTLDIGLARQDLGYSPRVTLDQGMDEFAAWWREQHGK
ncbi:NAD-dependent epimerase/dehydratase family protein [Paenibacillus hexagrammi]|uniref:NAD(P)-dependent oxidoreductase n=1 Tax=Paenibacillus hexagrammi TaxID=2908839 RepID=A0ABY3SPB1_9BACL|nr:NAD(P)-dependent oxidoreductase [Paenibacillus sp. YPD9-1]UJF34975.1 NAD(P)-dependent oxidoreductase [Paenibacillus sp. YPD9-1]